MKTLRTIYITDTRTSPSTPLFEFQVCETLAGNFLAEEIMYHSPHHGERESFTHETYSSALAHAYGMALEQCRKIMKPQKIMLKVREL